MAKKVEDYLREVDYRKLNTFVPSVFSINFVNFIKLVNGEEGEENTTPAVHYKMLDTMVYSESKRILNLCHRGISKTTVMGEYLFLYLAVYGEIANFGKVDLALYVSDSIENGVKNMRKNLEHRWENSTFLQTYVPHIRFTDTRWEFKNATGNTLIIMGFGAKTGVRGIKAMGTRPKLAVLDDLVSDEDARSDTVIQSIEDTIYSKVDFALHPDHNMIIWSGTPFNTRDPLYKAVESGVWDTNVFPVCEVFPCSEEEFSGSWPDRFTYKFVNAKYEAALALGKIASFNQELMLQIMTDEDRMIRDADIKWYKRDQLLSNKGKFNFYITTDYATSVRESGDFSVTSVWAYSADGSWYYVDGVCKRQLMSDNINDLFKFAQRYKPQLVGIEVSGQQGGFISWIQEQMLVRNIYFTLASENNRGQLGIRPGTNKMERFNTVVPLFKMGKIFFPHELRKEPTMREAMTELSLVSMGGFKSKHDDFIDSISMLPLLGAWRPSEEAPSSLNQENNIWELDEVTEQVSRLDSYIV